jgi:hypothetical protein
MTEIKYMAKYKILVFVNKRNLFSKTTLGESVTVGSANSPGANDNHFPLFCWLQGVHLLLSFQNYD